MATTKPTRVLLKLSGELFAGSLGHGIDPEFVDRLAKELSDVVKDTGVELAVVVGGGNFIRGATIAHDGIDLTTGHYMGMITTILNGMALVDVLLHNNQPARLQTRLRADIVAEPYSRGRATRQLEKGRILVVAGGTGAPYVTTDTAAVTTALETGCQLVLKATKVDGIYDRDPHKHADATRHDRLSFDQVLTNPHMNVMDNAAISLAMDNHLPIVIFDLLTPGNIRRVIEGEMVGTRVS